MKQRSLRIAALGLFGSVALAGCAQAADSTSTDSKSSDSASTESSAPSSSTTTESALDYTDGTYTAEGSYSTPETVETISVTITLESDVVTDVEVSGDPQARESKEFQSQFIGGISDEVVGKDLDDISVSRVAGSSLTSTGFNAALEEIKTEAAA